MEPLPPDPDKNPTSLDPEPEVPTDIQGSKIDLDDIPARVAERAPDVFPQRIIGLSFLVLAVIMTVVVIGIALLMMLLLNGR